MYQLIRSDLFPGTLFVVEVVASAITNTALIPASDFKQSLTVFFFMSQLCTLASYPRVTEVLRDSKNCLHIQLESARKLDFPFFLLRINSYFSGEFLFS